MCVSARTELPCVPASAQAARGWAERRLLEMYDTAEIAVDDLALVVSELVTNCIRTHAHSFVLGLSGHHTWLSVATTDSAPGRPRVRDAAVADDSGRGLAIVEAISSDWGVLDRSHEKTVWARLPVPPAARPRFRCTPPDELHGP